MTFEKTYLKIPSATKGWDLDAWQYLPISSSSTRLPVIVMAHGLSADKTMGLEAYGEAFSTAGYGCIVFDYRRWGTSDGAPRNVVVVKEQLEDYRTVIKYARQQAQFDPQRVVIWGSSFSGGHAITLSTQPAVNACAALAQCPYAGVYPSNPFGWTYLMTVAFMLLDLLKQALGLPPAYIPAVAKPGAVGALTSEGTVTGMMTLVSPESQYTNQISASSLLQIPLYQPRSKAKEIACPLLLFVPTKDNLCLPAGAREVAATAPEGRCQLVEAECGHFDIYHGTSHYKQALTAQLAFLAKHVPL